MANSFPLLGSDGYVLVFYGFLYTNLTLPMLVSGGHQLFHNTFGCSQSFHNTATWYFHYHRSSRAPSNGLGDF